MKDPTPQWRKNRRVVELSRAEREVLDERDRRLLELQRAVLLAHGLPLAGLRRVARVLPEAASVEVVIVHLRAEDTDSLYLVAAEGLASRDLRDLALEPTNVAKQRSFFSLTEYHSHARNLSLGYVRGEWLQWKDSVVGSLTTGCRTDRRPSENEKELVRAAAAELTPTLLELDRREENLRKLALEVARAAVIEPPDLPPDLLTELRPREATVLHLYAEGRTADDIAALLVVSPHTVRTHIKLAFRRLGIHSRREAADIVRTSELAAHL